MSIIATLGFGAIGQYQCAMLQIVRTERYSLHVYAWDHNGDMISECIPFAENPEIIDVWQVGKGWDEAEARLLLDGMDVTGAYCPVCFTDEIQMSTPLPAFGFKVEIMTCTHCGASWTNAEEVKAGVINGKS